nr:ribonuclease H [Ipomoea batatas]
MATIVSGETSNGALDRLESLALGHEDDTMHLLITAGLSSSGEDGYLREFQLLQDKIKRIQESDFYNSSNGLHVFERKLQAELNSVLREEEMLWFQKARKAWIHDGDRNTSYYHRAAIIRRNRGRVRTLKINGHWVSADKVIKDHITNFFKALISKNQLTTEGMDEYWGGIDRDENGFEWIWRLGCLERCKTFIWLLIKGKLLTNMERVKRNFSSDNIFPLCGDGEESLEHVFRLRVHFGRGVRAHGAGMGGGVGVATPDTEEPHEGVSTELAGDELERSEDDSMAVAEDISLAGEICTSEDEDTTIFGSGDNEGVETELLGDEKVMVGRVWGCGGKGCGGELYG